eukprot:gene11541-14098_t
MNHPVDPIGEADLQAYVDDQLPVARRIDVEAHLSRHPEQATRVMADLRTRDELRLALAAMPRIASIATSDAARRLERGLSRDHLFTRLRKVAAVAVIRNPFAGRYVEDLSDLIDIGAELGDLLGRRCVEALGIEPGAVESYGKAAMVGEDGELEHAA